MYASIAHHAHKAAIYTLLCGPHGVLSGSGDGYLLEWRTTKPEEVKAVASFPSAVLTACAIGDHLYAGTLDGELFLIDRSTKLAVRRIALENKGIYSIVALRKERIACSGGDGTLSVFSIGNGSALEERRSIPLCDAKLRRLAFNGQLLAVACGDGPVRILEIDRFNEAGTCAGHADGSNSLAWHPNKPVLVSGGKDGWVRMWHRDSFKEVLSFAAHRSTIYDIAFSGDGRYCATASRDKTVKIWDANTFEPLERLDHQHGGHSHSVNALLWMGSDLYSGGDDRKLIRWTRDQNG